MMGENTMVSLEIPRGCNTNSRIKIAQVTPTMVDFSILSFTTVKPCTAPKTD
jgi:hypothetical protein